MEFELVGFLNSRVGSQEPKRIITGNSFSVPVNKIDAFKLSNDGKWFVVRFDNFKEKPIFDVEAGKLRGVELENIIPLIHLFMEGVGTYRNWNVLNLDNLIDLESVCEVFENFEREVVYPNNNTGFQPLAVEKSTTYKEVFC